MDNQMTRRTFGRNIAAELVSSVSLLAQSSTPDMFLFCGESRQQSSDPDILELVKVDEAMRRLTLVRGFGAKSEGGVDFVVLNYSNRVAAVATPKGRRPTAISIVDMDTGSTIQNVPVRVDSLPPATLAPLPPDILRQGREMLKGIPWPATVTGWTFVNHAGLGLALVLQLASESGVALYAVPVRGNPPGLEGRMVAAHLTNMIREGTHGIGESTGSGMPVDSYVESGTLRIPSIGGRLDTGIRGPDGPGTANSPGQRWLIDINNDRLLAARRHPDPESIGSGDGLSFLYVYQKLSKGWTKVGVPGTFPLVRAVGPFLLGVASSPVPRVRGARVQPSRPSPGKAARDLIAAQQRQRGEKPGGSGIDQIGVFYPGILFAIDTSTGVTFQIRTNQGDSEILYAEGRWIYYRVLNELFKVPIVEGKFLGPPHSILKDDRILSAHWAFMGR